MNDYSPSPVRGRVSISQRFAPAASFALTAIGGILGAWWTLLLFQQLRNDESATGNMVLNGLSSISQSVGLIYAVAAFVGIVAIVVMRMRSDDDEAVLPGFTYLAGLPALISPAVSAYAVYVVIAAFHTPNQSEFAKVGARVAELIIASISAGGIALLFLLPFTFLPFSARHGKRISPIITLGLVLVGIVSLAVLSFWLVAFSQEPRPPFGK